MERDGEVEDGQAEVNGVLAGHGDPLTLILDGDASQRAGFGVALGQGTAPAPAAAAVAGAAHAAHVSSAAHVAHVSGVAGVAGVAGGGGGGGACLRRGCSFLVHK